ncbi:MAG: VWA domain-containing protein [bacterium]|nr:VWA domain-containing protein [bacterium]
MRFATPYFLSLLLFLPFLIWVYLKRGRSRPSIKFSDLEGIKEISPSRRLNPRHILTGLRIIAIGLIIIGLSRPQTGVRSEEQEAKGIDIMLCIDTSTSMEALDFKPYNRLDAAKEAARRFIDRRKNDRIGIVVFSGLGFTQCPLTMNHRALLDLLDKVEVGMVQVDGTAIGTAIITCINRLKESGAKSKIIVLLTDGRNNMGEIDPLTSAQVAKTMGIKIYTIGAGSLDGALYPVDHPLFGRRYMKLHGDLDEEILRKIAKETGGLYFYAKNTKALNDIYKQIDKMEKSRIKVKKYIDYIELFPYFIWPAFSILFLEVILGNTLFRKIP